MKRSAMFFRLFVVLGITLLFFPTSVAQADTPWPGGTISASVTWTKANSPYILSGQVTIPAGLTLTIEPGVTVKSPFMSGGFLIQAGGKLNAVGTSSLPISFTAIDITKLWFGFIVNDGGILRLDYCDIAFVASDYWHYGDGALYLWGSDVQVRNTRIHHSTINAGIWIASVGLTPLFENVTIDNNTGMAIHQKFITAQPVYHNIIMHDNAGGDFVYISDGKVNDRDATLDSTGLDGKNIMLGTGSQIQANRTLTITPGTEIRMVDSYITVENGGKLAAEGTAANPIHFTTADPTKSWYGVLVKAGGSARLNYCDIAYAAGNYWDYGNRSVLSLFSSDVEVRNSRIHDNTTVAIVVNYESHPLLRNNQFYNNSYGLLNWNSKVWVDARFNYWGDPTGPKNLTRNPSGLGQEVSDKVTFAPWYEDTQGNLMQKVFLQVVGPTRAAPGEKLEYQVLYFAGAALTDAVLTFTLPDTANFLSATHNGAYYPKTGQVYWELGDLPALAEGARAVTVQALWGLPRNYPDAVVALMGSPSMSILPYVIDTAPLKEYTPITATGSTILTSPQIDAALLGSANLKTLYDGAIAQGFRRVGGSVISTSDGKSTTQISLIHATKGLMNVRLDASSGAAEAITVTAKTFTMTNQEGSVTLDLTGNQVLHTGGWDLKFAGPQTAEHPLLTPFAEISPYVCWRNCMLQAAGMWAISKLSNTLDATLKAVNCAMALTEDGPAAASCFLALEKVSKLVPGISEIKETLQCTAECANSETRSKYVCSGSLTTVEPPTWAWTNLASWTASGAKRQYVRYTCDPTTNMWGFAEILYCPTGFVAEAGAKDADGTPCVPANDDVAFAYGYPDRKVPSSRSKLTLNPAKDPNAKYGVNGSTQSAVLPGQELTYTITFENEGAGTAYGVYVLDTLAAQLDVNTLNLNGKGQYYPASRQIAWDIGELASKGQTGSTGSVTFSITPQAGLPAGTEIVNRGIVYFPSVPEETPTNAVINTIQPVVAIPQEVQATAGLAKPITLQGAGPGTLTFQVVDTPMHGSLTGSASSLNYTADAAFSGTDIFSFQVQSSAGTSPAAQVIITVSPNPAETTPPVVLWSSPGAGSILLQPNPASFTDANGTGYFPQIIVQFSEALDAATVIPANVTLTAGGSPKTASVAFMAGSNQVIIIPRQVLPVGTPITLTISTAVKDTQGNSLAAPFTASFQLTAAQVSGRIIFLPLAKK